MEQNEMKKVRYNWPDVMKLLGMVCVFIIHSQRCGDYIFLCRCVALALFFIPAGVFAGKSLMQPFGEFLKNNFLRIMVPYFIFSVVAAVCNVIIYGTSLPAVFLKVLYGGREHLPGAALWFLPALFCVRLYLYIGNRIAQKLSADRKKQMIYLSGWVILVWGISSVIRHFLSQMEIHGISNLPLPWSADCAGVFLPIYFTGYLLADPLKKFSWGTCNILWKIAWWLCIGIVLVFSIKPDWWKIFYRMVSTGNDVLDCMVPEFLCAAPLLFGILCIAKMLDKVNIFGKLGGDTLYYCGLEGVFELTLAGIGWICSAVFAGAILFEPSQWHFAVYVAVEMLLMILFLTPVFKKILHPVLSCGQS